MAAGPCEIFTMFTIVNQLVVPYGGHSTQRVGSLGRGVASPSPQVGGRGVGVEMLSPKSALGHLSALQQLILTHIHAAASPAASLAHRVGHTHNRLMISSVAQSVTRASPNAHGGSHTAMDAPFRAGSAAPLL